jgi:hypothetical protein
MVESTINAEPLTAAVVNKSKFDRQELTTSVIVPNHEIGTMQRKFFDYILTRPKFKAIIPLEND